MPDFDVRQFFFDIKNDFWLAAKPMAEGVDLKK